MSKYTIEVRYICETAAGLRKSEGLSSVNQIITKAVPKIFDFDFPMFDESYRHVLETKILRHYYTREIGLETVGLWKLKLETKLNEIMPYYNQLYKSELLEFNPFYDVDLTRDHKLTRNETVAQKETVNTSEDSNTDESTTSDSTINNTTSSTSDDNATATKTHYDKYSDTPQGSLQNVQNDTYLTNARMINDNDKQTDKTTVNGTGESKGNTNAESSRETRRNVDVNSTNSRGLNSLDDYVEHVKGKNGGASYPSLLKEFRETFINIDMMIIGELSELFFNLW